MSVRFAEDLQSNDLIAVTVARETTGRRARPLLEILDRDRNRGNRRPLRLRHRNNELVVPVGAEAIVKVNRATWGKLRAAWQSISVSRTKRYAVLLPDRAIGSGAALLNASSRRELLQRRFDVNAEPVMSAIERVGPRVEVRDDAELETGVLGNAAAAPDPHKVTVDPVAAFKLMFVDVPLLESEKFEQETWSAGARCRPIAPLPIRHSKPRFPRDRSARSSEGLGQNPSPAGVPGAAAVAPTTIRLGAVDTGLSLVGEEFAGRNGSVLFAQFNHEGVHAITAPIDNHGHGTCVLTRAAGARSGIVPNASLVVASALDHRLWGGLEQITKAISWVISQDNVDVVNLSLCSTNGFGYAIYKDIFSEVLETASGLGIYLVAATGNSGEGWIGAPGAYRNVHGVGATDARGDFWKHSSHGFVIQENNLFKPNWIAHGVAQQSVQNVEVGHMGTSFACPVVSGIVLRSLVRGLDPIAELERCSEPCSVGAGRHKGDCRRINWPVPE